MLRKGRFSENLNIDCAKFMSSLETDKRLFHVDIALNKAHVSMLAKKDIITDSEAKEIHSALERIEKEGVHSLDADPTIEDIHMAIEKKVTAILGDAGKKMHTAKSRNDQVAADLRLLLREDVVEIILSIERLLSSLLTLAKEHTETVMMGYTHLQHAQVTTLAHYFLAYHSFLVRDIERLEDAKKRINISPLGACAFSGTTYPIDRDMTADELGFLGIIENTQDAVSSRDFILETMSALSILSVDLSRIASDFILWSSLEFGYIHLPDSLSSTSSIMPQKKNPDLLELIRAKLGSIRGETTTAFNIASNLAHSYNRDLQQISLHLFSAVDSIKEILFLLNLFIKECTFNKENMKAKINLGYYFATDLADYLVEKYNIAFRTSYEIVGELILALEKTGEKEYIGFIQRFFAKKSVAIKESELQLLLDPLYLVNRRLTVGSPSSKEVLKSIHKIEKKVKR